MPLGYRMVDPRRHTFYVLLCMGTLLGNYVQDLMHSFQLLCHCDLDVIVTGLEPKSQHFISIKGKWAATLRKTHTLQGKRVQHLLFILETYS